MLPRIAAANVARSCHIALANNHRWNRSSFLVNRARADDRHRGV
jgi:hypothetical protein